MSSMSLPTDFNNRINTLLKSHQNRTTSAKGDVAYVSTLSAIQDLYAAQGALRGRQEEFLDLFDKTFKEDKEYALAALFKLRDIRNGMGERELFRSGLRYLEGKMRIEPWLLDMIVEYGRTDDLFAFTHVESLITVARYLASFIYNILDPKRADKYKYTIQYKQKANIVKWLPKRTQKNQSKRFVMMMIRNGLKLSPKEYRKTLTKVNDVVETKLTNKDYVNIDYNHVPSRAMMIYSDAFQRHDARRYLAWQSSLSDENSKSKVNSAALYPYELVKQYINWDAYVDNANDLIEAQWKALPNFLGDTKLNILPMIDCSGSMTSIIPGASCASCLHAAISLGLYISERNQGKWQYAIESFGSNPKLYTVKDLPTMFDRVNKINGSNDPSSTNIRKALSEVFRFTKYNQLTEDEQLDVLVILSDMNFDAGCDDAEALKQKAQLDVDQLSRPKWVVESTVARPKTLIEEIQEDASKLGCKIPKIIYWNLNHNGTFQCTNVMDNVIEISGFSPSIMKDVLANIDNLNPSAFIASSLTPYIEKFKSLALNYDNDYSAVFEVDEDSQGEAPFTAEMYYLQVASNK